MKMKKIPLRWVLPGLAVVVLLLSSWQVVERPASDAVLPKETPSGQAEATPTTVSSQPKQDGPAGTASGEQSKSKLVLKELRPSETKAGQVFNKQPNGESAVVCMTENATRTVVIVLNNEPQETAYGDANWVSAFVPRKFYQTAGDIKVHVLDQKTNEKSNELIFKVKP